MKDVIILGGGGFASEVVELIEEINKTLPLNENINVLGFIYEGVGKNQSQQSDSITLCDLPVLGDFDCLSNFNLAEVYFICGVGTPELKKRFVLKIKQLGGNFITIIHPDAFVSKRAVLGEGCIIQRHCILTGVDIVLGDFVTLNDNVEIGHAAKIGSFSHINPNVNISGEAEVGEDVFIGVKATILKCKIGHRTVIGACTLVTRDMPENLMAKGIPAVYSLKTSKRY